MEVELNTKTLELYRRAIVTIRDRNRELTTGKKARAFARERCEGRLGKR